MCIVCLLMLSFSINLSLWIKCRWMKLASVFWLLASPMSSSWKHRCGKELFAFYDRLSLPSTCGGRSIWGMAARNYLQQRLPSVMDRPKYTARRTVLIYNKQTRVKTKAGRRHERGEAVTIHLTNRDRSRHAPHTRPYICLLSGATDGRCCCCDHNYYWWLLLSRSEGGELDWRPLVWQQW